jgi:mono/diheme cytochrome c family protein
MPTFGFSDDHAASMVRYFGAVDRLEVPFVHIEPAMLRPDSVHTGELLASKDYLSCWSCHVRGDQNPEGSPDSWAPDLAMAAQRLYPDWIVRWLQDPQKLMPGTKMPTFYADPNATDGPPDILDGNDDEQIKALRDYVISLGLPPTPQPPPAQTASAAP